MKLYEFKKRIYKDWITFIPTIEIHMNNPLYREKNIELMLHIFIWHFMWMFIKESEE